MHNPRLEKWRNERRTEQKETKASRMEATTAAGTLLAPMVPTLVHGIDRLYTSAMSGGMNIHVTFFSVKRSSFSPVQLSNQARAQAGLYALSKFTGRGT